MKLYLFIFALVIFNTFLSAQETWHIQKNQMNFAVLISNYSTYNIEKGNLSTYAPYDGNLDKLPLKVHFVEPVDFGSITFSYTKTSDTLFTAGIEWQALGKINYPNTFLSADSFPIAQIKTNPPESIEYFYNNISGLDSTIYKIKADSAWNVMDSLDVVNKFSAYPYRVGIYLYTPGEGIVDSSGHYSNLIDAKWVAFLYYDKSTITDVNKINNLPDKIELTQNFPNPFNPSTIIEYKLSRKEPVTLKVYDLQGRLVSTLVDKKYQTQGTHKIIFYAKDLSSGVYFYKLSISNSIIYKKMILMK